MESELIDKIRARLPLPSARTHVSIGDDAAIVTPPHGKMAVTVDMMVEGVHFDWSFCTPEDVGYKALAVNLSDLAAMNAHPCYAVVSLALPANFAEETVLRLYDGLARAAHEFSVDVVGGNLSSTPGGWIVDITAIGEVETPQLRTGLREGDWIAVTGPLGAAALGLEMLRQNPMTTQAPDCVRRYLRPMPRLAVAQRLVQTGCVHAMIDLSDGLSTDVRHLAQASNVRICLDQAALPRPREWRALNLTDSHALDLMLNGGGDYELLVGLDGQAWTEAVVGDLALKDLVHIIGEVESEESPGEVFLRTDQGIVPLPPKGWDHLRQTAKSSNK